MNFYSKVLQLSKLPRCRERQILPNQNISKVEQMVNSAILAEERKCQKNILGGGGEQGFIEIWYNEHLSGQTLVSQQTIGLTEQLD